MEESYLSECVPPQVALDAECLQALPRVAQGGIQSSASCLHYYEQMSWNCMCVEYGTVLALPLVNCGTKGFVYLYVFLPCFMCCVLSCWGEEGVYTNTQDVKGVHTSSALLYAHTSLLHSFRRSCMFLFTSAV